MTEIAVRAHLAEQARACASLGSPFTAALLSFAAERLGPETETGRRVLGWAGDPKADALALRLAGGLHALARSGDAPGLAAAYPPHAAAPDWSAVVAALAAHDARVAAFLDGPPQTNEVARAAMLWPALGAAARACGPRLALLEIGASAGLVLRLDRYAMAYGAGRPGGWAHRPPAAPLALAPDIVGAPPPEAPPIDVVARAGCDVAPIDPRDPAARARLEAYVWADQTARFARLRAALASAAADGLAVERADAAAWLAARLPERPADAATVVMHSVMWQYLPAPTQAAIEATLRAEGARATTARPLAWLRMEGFGAPGAASLRLTLWRGGEPETRELADVDWHGRWLAWRPEIAGLERLRRAEAGERATIEALVEAAYARYVPRMGRRPAPMDDDYAGRIARGEAFVLPAAGGRVDALVVLEPHADHLMVDNIAVAESARGQGLGRALLGFAAWEARRLGLAELRLYTHATMVENQALYARLGWERLGERTEDGFSRVYFRKAAEAEG